MVCSNCGTENRAGRRFCTACGNRLAVACPSCGTAVEAGDAFCGECGSPLGGGAPAAAGAPPLAAATTSPETERRLVSVLFADLVGFTSLSEARDAEEVRELLSRYFEVCRSLIERYGGLVEKFIGDAVMAVWGAQAANEDDAERAVRTALDLVEAIAALGREMDEPGLAARAGVLTGEAAVNLRAEGQGMVAGDLVNSASRLQSAAEPGTVLVGEATFHAASAAIDFEDRGAIIVKGKAEPVHVWQALRVVGKRGGLGRTEGLEPPFVGREDELQLIKTLLHTVSREGRPRLVSIMGIPGIGKSRLAWEFLKYVDGLAETVYWHQGRSPAYGESISFWALSEMVRMRAGITEAEEADSAKAKLAAMTAEFISDAAERRWIEPRLAHLLGLTDGVGGEREELFSAWRALFERVAERGPVVMVFEDLQWADAGLLDFVESVLEWSRNSRILILTLARPELSELRPTWGAGQRRFTSLHLEPLGDDAMRSLLREFVRGVPDEVVDAMLARAEGIPLYAVETVRMLADQGLLARQRGGYEIVGRLDDLAVPDTLHALIASRLDALAPGQRALLQDAAVLGKTFAVPALCAATGRETSELEDDLRALTRKEFLTLDVDLRSPERGQYGFTQDLIRTVAYSTLARRDRRAKHLAVAHHFDALGDEELAGVVAAHYLEAYRESREGPERAALAGKAREWLRRAGERALSLGSPEQALAYFEQALQAGAGSERAALLELAGEAAFRASRYEQAVMHLEEAISRYQEAGDVVAVGRATARLAIALGLGLSRYAEAIERAERAEALLRDDEAPQMKGELGEALTHLYALSGSPERALVCAERALALAERLDDAALLADALRARAFPLFDLGRHREALILARGVVALAEGAELLITQARGYNAVSIFALDESLRESKAASIKGAELARRAGDRGLEVNNLLNAVETSLLAGDWDYSRRAIEELGQRELSSRDRDRLAMLTAILAALTGDPARAAAIMDSVATRSEISENVQTRATFLCAWALIHLAGGDLTPAQRDAIAAAETDPGVNSATALPLQARASLWLRDVEGAGVTLPAMERFRGRRMAAMRTTVESGIAALEGRDDEAAGGYPRAVEAWRQIDSPLDLALCRLDMVALLPPDHPLVAAAAAEARETFERIGAAPFLKRLDDCLARGATVPDALPTSEAAQIS